MLKKVFIICCLSILVNCLPAISQNSPSPQGVLSKVVSGIKNSKGTEANFTIYNSGYSGKGTIKTLGNKFYVAFPDVEVWYNGKDLYTLNLRTEETTVVVPSNEELSETNPLTYVVNAPEKYNVAYSTVKKPGKFVLELLPKSKSEIKRITLTVNSSDYKPEKIVVELTSGQPISAEINNFKMGINIDQSMFNYPANKYPKIEIIDLR